MGLSIPKLMRPLTLMSLYTQRKWREISTQLATEQDFSLHSVGRHVPMCFMIIKIRRRSGPNRNQQLSFRESRTEWQNLKCMMQ